MFDEKKLIELFHNNKNGTRIYVSRGDLIETFKYLNQSKYDREQKVLNETWENNFVLYIEIMSLYHLDKLDVIFNYVMSSTVGLTTISITLTNDKKKVYLIERF